MIFNKRIGGIILIVLFLWTGCDKKNLPDDLRGIVWKLEGLVRANGNWEPNDAEQEIRFEFLVPNGVRIQLPVNDCGADVVVLTEGQIRLGTVACTEVCCESQYTEDFMAILSQVVSYYVKGKKLYLQGPQGSAIFIK